MSRKVQKEKKNRSLLTRILERKLGKVSRFQRDSLELRLKPRQNQVGRELGVSGNGGKAR